MPVKLLSSSVIKWPDAQTVIKDVENWAKRIKKSNKNVLRIGYFGSYAKGNWGVGSDIDVIIIVKQADQPFIRRASEWDATILAVPADLLVYTSAEWQKVCEQGKICRNLIEDVKWI